MTDNSKPREALLQEAQRFYDQTPALQTVALWPTDLTLAEKIPDTPPDINPALDVMQNWQSEQPFHQAIRRAINVISWRQTYSEAEVGRDFIDAFDCFELLCHEIRWKELEGFDPTALLVDESNRREEP